MIHQLSWQTSTGVRGLVCSKFRAVKTGAPANEAGVAISLESDEECESLLAELEMHFAAQRFASSEAAFEAVKSYALERASRKRPK
jgi:hypothetical protein